MECYNCGIIIGQEKVCPNCGTDLRIYRKFVAISNYLYNQALAKAKERDLSGAVSDLRLSLQYNKVNTNARNLLGLVYYEMGEGVAAVREWLISKGYQAQENRASVYLEQTKKHPGEKEHIDQMARKYNQVLAYCNQGSLDLAVIQLKKLLSNSPHFVRGWQLLALIYIQNQELEQARKALRKAEAIDIGNPTTSRYQKEVAEQIHQGNGKKKKKAQAVAYQNGNDTIIQPKLRGDVGFWGMAANLLVGVAVGVAITWYLVVPGVRKQAVSDASVAVTEANNTISDKNQTIKSLEEQIDALTSDVADAKSDTADRDAAIEASESLLTAYDAYINDDIELAGDTLESVDESLLSKNAKKITKNLREQINQQYLTKAYDAGMQAYNSGKYEEAIEQLSKVAATDETYEDGNALYNLAQSYRKMNELEQALDTYQKVVDQFPDTNLAYNANRYVRQLTQTLERQSQ
jgi:Flp pilus assembly protein TadD